MQNPYWLRGYRDALAGRAKNFQSPADPLEALNAAYWYDQGYFRGLIEAL